MTEKTNDNPQDRENEIAQGQFGMQKIYVKDVSFETPHSPQVGLNLDMKGNSAVLPKSPTSHHPDFRGLRSEQAPLQGTKHRQILTLE